MGTQSHISKIVAHLIGKLKVSWEDAEDESLYLSTFLHISPQKLYKLCADDVRKELRRMSPETLGKLAIQGKARVVENALSGVKANASGRDILLELALAAVIAEMANQLEGRYQI